jgi:hypothetical protein
MRDRLAGETCGSTRQSALRLQPDSLADLLMSWLRNGRLGIDFADP